MPVGSGPGPLAQLSRSVERDLHTAQILRRAALASESAGGCLLLLCAAVLAWDLQRGADPAGPRALALVAAGFALIAAGRALHRRATRLGRRHSYLEQSPGRGADLGS